MESKLSASGCLFGLALGDALAAPVEFIRSAEDIEAIYGKGGPAELEGDPARVTDDTQMAATFSVPSASRLPCVSIRRVSPTSATVMRRMSRDSSLCFCAAVNSGAANGHQHPVGPACAT